MYSNFQVTKSGCMTCNNEVLKQIGLLQGVFGAEIDRIDGKIVVNHTDEVSRETIAMKLEELGWMETSEDQGEPVDYDDPSLWGCAL